MSKNHDDGVVSIRGNKEGTTGTVSEPSAAERVRSYVHRYLALAEEKAQIAESQSDILRQAKNDGFDVKVLREVIRRASADKEEIEQHNALVDIYERAVNGEEVVFEKVGGQHHPADV